MKLGKLAGRRRWLLRVPLLLFFSIGSEPSHAADAKGGDEQQHDQQQQHQHQQHYWTPPRPTQRQLDFMELELAQFMHFGINTFWDPPGDFLYGGNPTYHNCYTTAVDHTHQTGVHYPCLSPEIFNPTNLNCDEWMVAAKSMGTKEICLTAAHEGKGRLSPLAHSQQQLTG
jgi:hypothetical protein